LALGDRKIIPHFKNGVFFEYNFLSTVNNKTNYKKDNMMKKIIMTLLLSLLVTNANAGMYGWSTPNLSGGYNYFSSDKGMSGWSTPNLVGGYNYFSTDKGMSGWSTPNLGGGYNYFKTR
jgi:hypothetical protein